MNYEINNARKDANFYNGRVTKTSPVVEIFSAMINGKSLDRFGKKADVGVNYIKNLYSKAENNDSNAIAELNTIRRFTIETPILEEIKMLSVFGSYKNVGFDESIEREVYNHVGEKSREQAANGDVVFPTIQKTVYPVPTFTVSGGYKVDYRRAKLGDMSKENEGMAQVKTDILNNAKLACVKKIYNSVKNATGVKYMYEFAGLTKDGVDEVLTKIRRIGRTTVIADYAIISQFTPWAGYVGTISKNTITGISEKAMNEIAQTGTLSMYNGTILAELENPYNEYKLNAAGDNFEPLFPAGLGLIIPTGVNSPIATYTKGGLTSFSGNDVKTGEIVTRFDIEVGCDIAKGQEHHIGIIYDTNIGGLD